MRGREFWEQQELERVSSSTLILDNSKISNIRKIAVIILKFEESGHRVKLRIFRMAKCADTDQTVLLLWDQLFSCDYLSDNTRKLLYD